ncbi:hypothetical protein [Aminipila sp.]|uniref:hypothetical protein n=1 Tax=Aminipila sp. TaxID=2060095 RepID=UPI00289FA3AF|nr:hypothetical protein [Aminipila sp.]
MNINEWAKEIHNNAVNHGWWEKIKPLSETIALCHSELSEALEEARTGNRIPNKENEPPMLYFSGYGYVASDITECCKKPEGIAVEMVDCLIRILDWFESENIDVEYVLELKHEYNKTRPYKHGGKKF